MPSGEPSDRQLESAIWYVKHKLILRKIVVGLIVAVDAALLGLAFKGIGLEFLGFEKRQTQEYDLLRTAIPEYAARQASRPADLELGGIELIRVGGAVDVAVRVRNPNADWYAKFEYAIGVGDKVEKASDGFLLPAEERLFTRSILGASAGTTVFNIENISWRRVRKSEVGGDFAKWRDERLNFTVSDTRFSSAVVQGKGELSRVYFSIKNETAFGYREPTFLILLYRGSRLVGVQNVVLEKLASGQTREVEASWVDRVGSVTNIEVAPVIDIMDEAVYLKPSA